ncbi:MAG: tetratricopeptide repeat protein [Candidatus Aminicenantes bacterium]|nr:tetratricopeptide repeat protein [Candidatus Aminicenantes bacterium]
MRKTAVGFVVCFLVSISLHASLFEKHDEILFQEAKILLFDKKWEKAQEKLEEILEDYPKSRVYSEAVFYLGRCLEEQDGKEAQALGMYKKYIRLDDRSRSFEEESEIAVIDLSFQMYEKDGQKSYLKEIEKKFSSKNKVVRYWAAFKISKLKDLKVARRAKPILMDILEEEKDDELRDRAKIYLLRIAPDAFKDYEEEKYERNTKVLKLRVYKKGKKEPDFSLNIPWALADLALAAIPDDIKMELRGEGYDLDKIAAELTRVKGSILEIKGEKSVFKFWID